MTLIKSGQLFLYPFSHADAFWYIIGNFTPFPHIDAFWCLCSRRLFKNIVTKEEIAQNEQFLLLPQCFSLLVIGYPFCCRIVVWGKVLRRIFSFCQCFQFYSMRCYFLERVIKKSIPWPSFHFVHWTLCLPRLQLISYTSICLGWTFFARLWHHF